MPSLRFLILVATILCAAVAVPRRAIAQPIELLRSAPPAAPRAPADVAEAPPQATKSASGLAWKVLVKSAETARPGQHDKVILAFTAWTPEGEVIDSSIPDGEPRTFSMDDVIKGLFEGVGAMAKGEKRRLWIPAALAAAGQPRHRAGGACVFDVALVDFVAMPDPMPVPDDVDATPADAKRTSSGLAYKLVKRGKGKAHPTAASTVEVHYTGWTPDGKVFDSSVRRGKSVSFSLGGVIKGWTEGVQLMVVGDRMRFWIPSALAYGDKPSQPGTPAGPLVFEIDLLSMR